jgi:hypothetical protein
MIGVKIKQKFLFNATVNRDVRKSKIVKLAGKYEGYKGWKYLRTFIKLKFIR